jgi:hypothetical protein
MFSKKADVKRKNLIVSFIYVKYSLILLFFFPGF